MKLEKAIEILYDNEINCGFHSFWDGGFSVFIGDDANGIRKCQNFESHEIDDIGNWYIAEAIDLGWLDSSDFMLDENGYQLSDV